MPIPARLSSILTLLTPHSSNVTDALCSSVPILLQVVQHQKAMQSKQKQIVHRLAVT
jgi:hypothetical protein